MLYAVVCIVSTIVRQFYLPNPFECFGSIAFLINIIAEPIIHVVALKTVGLMGYRGGSAPALGSFLYLAVYSAIVGLLKIFSIHSFAWWWILVVILIIILLIIGIKLLGRRILYSNRQRF